MEPQDKELFIEWRRFHDVWKQVMTTTPGDYEAWLRHHPVSLPGCLNTYSLDDWMSRAGWVDTFDCVVYCDTDTQYRVDLSSDEDIPFEAVADLMSWLEVANSRRWVNEISLSAGRQVHSCIDHIRLLLEQDIKKISIRSYGGGFGLTEYTYCVLEQLWATYPDSVIRISGGNNNQYDQKFAEQMWIKELSRSLVVDSAMDSEGSPL